MRVELAYGNAVQAVDIPDENYLGSLSARPLPAATDVAAVVRHALQNPIGSAPFASVIRPGRSVTIVIGDTTRGWARPDLYLLPLVDDLNRLGVPDNLITVISGTGTHRSEERRVGKECRS